MWHHNAPFRSFVGTEIEFDTKQCDKFKFPFSSSLLLQIFFSYFVYGSFLLAGWDIHSQNKHTDLISPSIKLVGGVRSAYMFASCQSKQSWKWQHFSSIQSFCRVFFTIEQKESEQMALISVYRQRSAFSIINSFITFLH